MRSPFRHRFLDYIFLALLITAVVYGIRFFGTGNTDGPVVVVDGDSLRIKGRDIRLQGIDAPELHQMCQRQDGSSYACGRAAKRHLKKLIGGADVQCRQIDMDRYGRQVSVCYANGTNLNGTMVRDGWAVAYLRHSLNYAMAETKARRATRGIWQGEFLEPEEWRADRR